MDAGSRSPTAVAILFFAPRFSRTAAARSASGRDGSTAAASAVTAPPAGESRRGCSIAEDGTRLTSVERDVAYGETADEQRARSSPRDHAGRRATVSAIPPGTTLRAVFITKSGDAYVDLSREARAAHPGGTVDELLTIYTIVNALTVNLPAVTAVQVLVDGKEVDTLSGHVDLRHPLAKNLTWVQ
jgi:hypothetical protein